MPDSVSDNVGSTATLSVGSDTVCTIETFNDHDWYRVNLVAGQTYLFSTGISSTGFSSAITIRSAVGSALFQNIGGGFRRESALIFTARSSGDHFLDVGSVNNASVGSCRLYMDMTYPSATGDNGNNELVGTAGNDSISAGFGFDVIRSGTGDDFITVLDDFGLIDGGSGKDLVLFGDFAITIDLNIVEQQHISEYGSFIIRNVEDILGSRFADLMTGSAADNDLFGNDGNDTLDGRDGNDLLVGRNGDDILRGGNGNDRLTGDGFFINIAGIPIVQGNDTLDGGAGDDQLDGGGGLNLLFGGDGNDSLIAGAGNDWLVLTGSGVGHTRQTAVQTSRFSLVEHPEIDQSTIIPHTSFRVLGTARWFSVNVRQPGALVFDVDGASFDGILRLFDANGAQLASNDVGGFDSGSATNFDPLLRFQATSAGVYFIEVVTANGFTEGLEYTLNISVTGAPITVFGYAGSYFDGGPGNDTLQGDVNNDTFVGGVGADAISGGRGVDTASYAGDAGAVFVNLTLGQGFGNAAQGDSLSQIENLIGTTSDDTFIGDGLANRLDGGSGNDTLLGAIGADQLIGGAGTDTASYEDNQGPVFVNLLTGQGFGNAAQGDSFSGIEALRGSIFNDYFIGSDGANTLEGASGDDTLLGALGADVLLGGAGSDTASYEDNQGAVFINLTIGQGFGNAAQGDTYTGVENLTGTVFFDSFIGDANANVLDGALGNDTLTGAGGADIFVMSTPLNAAINVDSITDFTPVDDAIRLAASVFSAAGPAGTLAASAFVSGSAATTSAHRIVYDPTNGQLLYDADGSGGVGAVLFATIGTNLGATAADFVIA